MRFGLVRWPLISDIIWRWWEHDSPLNLTQKVYCERSRCVWQLYERAPFSGWCAFALHSSLRSYLASCVWQLWVFCKHHNYPWNSLAQKSRLCPIYSRTSVISPAMHLCSCSSQNMEHRSMVWYPQNSYSQVKTDYALKCTLYLQKISLWALLLRDIMDIS